MKLNLFILIIISYTFILGTNVQNINNSFFDELFHYHFSNAEKELLKINKKNNREKYLLLKSFLFMHKEQSGNKKSLEYGKLSVNYAEKVRIDLENKTLNDRQIFYYISSLGVLIKYKMEEKQYWTTAKHLYSASTEIKYIAENEYKNEEFQLISGLYHYYAELAADDYPVMRSVFLFLPKGDKKHGIKLLKSCSLSDSVFISAYSLYYLARIYHRDEKIFYKSNFFYKKLLNLYPENMFWKKEYLDMVEYFKE